MDDFMKDHLEAYLAGELTAREQSLWEARLKAAPKLARQVALIEDSAKLFDELRPPEDEAWAPEPGFYARVRERIAEQEQVPFWMVFLQPMFVRRVAFASLMWFALLGGYAMVFDNAWSGRDPHVAAAIFTAPPSADYEIRLGVDLRLNRDSMLAAMMTPRN